VDPIATAEDIITDNGVVVVGLVTGIFAATIGLRLVSIAVNRAGSALIRLAKGGS
jgi:hypothetical protein